MDSIKILSSINDAKLDIAIHDKTIHINLDGDIDLTDFVNVLYSLIDRNCLLEFVNPSESLDAKSQMIVETLNSIVEKYNETITGDIVERSSLQEKLIDASNDGDDIPF